MADGVVTHKAAHGDGFWALHVSVDDGELKLYVPLDIWNGAVVGANIDLGEVPELLKHAVPVGMYLKVDL